MSITNNITSNSALPISSDQSLRDLYSNTRGSLSSPRKIYFRRVTADARFSRPHTRSFFLLLQLPFNYAELEHRRPIRIFFTNPTKIDEQREVQLYVKKFSTVAEFLDEVKRWIPAVCSGNGSQQLR